MTTPRGLRSLRDFLQLLRTEIVDVAARAIVAATDPSAYYQCRDCAARARAPRTTAIPVQAAPPAAPSTPATTAAGPATSAVPPPPILTGPRPKVVTATCPTCGPVNVESVTVEGVFYQNNPDLNWYGFVCPKCEQRIVKPANSDQTAVLLSARTRIVIDNVPVEALEQHPTGVLRTDDVLDAILELDAHDDLAALAADAHQPAPPAREIDLRDGDR